MQILDGFFRSPAVEPFFTDSAIVQSILDFEAALARAEARAGMLSEAAATAIQSCCRANLFDLQALGEAVPSAGNLAIPLLKQLTALVARLSPEGSRHVHYGATSQDALDTGLMLQIRSATRAVQDDLELIVNALATLASSHRKTLMVGRTWLQHALPTTFGLVAAGWLDACIEHRRRFDSLVERSLALQFGGAVGTLAALRSRGGQIAALLAEELSLPLPPLPWHSQRERIGEIASAYALVSGTLGKIARDLSLQMQTEVAEVTEPAAAGRGGSSTMPHKQNPVACAAVLAAASRVPPLVSSILSSLSGEYQRSLGPWQSEWETLPEIVRLTGGASHHLAALLPGLTVHSEKMRANLERTRGLIYAEAVALALSDKLHRASAHRLVEAACRRAQSEGRNLDDILAADPEVTAILDRDALARLFEPANYLGSADLFIDGVLARAGSLVNSKG